MFKTFIWRFPSRKELQQVLTWHPSFPEGTTPHLQPRGNLPWGRELLWLMRGDASGPGPLLLLGWCEPTEHIGMLTYVCSHMCAHIHVLVPQSPDGLSHPSGAQLGTPRKDLGFRMKWNTHPIGKCVSEWRKSLCLWPSVNQHHLQFHSYVRQK